jgi:hypothetical protein
MISSTLIEVGNIRAQDLLEAGNLGKTNCGIGASPVEGNFIRDVARQQSMGILMHPLTAIEPLGESGFCALVNCRDIADRHAAKPPSQVIRQVE